MAFKNRIRLPFYIRQPQFPIERNVFRKANGETKVLSVEIRKTYKGITDWLSESIHQKLVVALSHDNVTIEGDRYLGGVVLSGEYQINYQEFLDYPKGQASFELEVTPFAESNDNCQTCEEATQLSLENDDLGTMVEGESKTINVFENDTICCSPITAEIVEFNTDYLESATIDDETGQLSVVVKDPAPSITNGVLVTYRVTCPNGGFDEADVIGTIEGSEESCDPPTELSYIHIEESELTVESDEVSWTGTGTFEWQLFECSNLGTPIDSGTTTDNFVTFLSLAPGSCYVFSVRKVCEFLNSAWVNIEFNTPAPESLCGRFRILADDGTTNRAAYEFSYMDCNGVIRDWIVVNLSDREVCMLVTNTNNPIFFTGEAPVSYEYIGVC